MKHITRSLKIAYVLEFHSYTRQEWNVNLFVQLEKRMFLFFPPTFSFIKKTFRRRHFESNRSSTPWLFFFNPFSLPRANGRISNWRCHWAPTNIHRSWRWCTTPSNRNISTSFFFLFLIVFSLPVFCAHFFCITFFYFLCDSVSTFEEDTF